MTRQPCIHSAASLFDEAERTFNRDVVSMIHDLGYSTWFPREDVGLLTDLVDELGMTLEQVREHIFQLNIKEVREADIRGGEPGGNNIMIDGIVNEIAGSIGELTELLEPVHTLIDLTGREPEVTIRHGIRVETKSEFAPTGTSG